MSRQKPGPTSGTIARVMACLRGCRSVDQFRYADFSLLIDLALITFGVIELQSLAVIRESEGINYWEMVQSHGAAIVVCNVCDDFFIRQSIRACARDTSLSTAYVAET